MATVNPHTTRATGTILTAAIYNADHQNHITNANNLNIELVEATSDILAIESNVSDLELALGGSATAGGTADALTLTVGASLTAYANGQIVSFRASADNTGAATITINSIGAKAIRNMTINGDVDVGAGDIQQTGIYIIQYSSALNAGAGAWLLVNPSLANIAVTTLKVVTIEGASGANGDVVIGCRTGSGIISLRPEGVGSSTNQVLIDTNGNMTVNGTITVTG